METDKVVLKSSFEMSRSEFCISREKESWLHARRLKGNKQSSEIENPNDRRLKL